MNLLAAAAFFLCAAANLAAALVAIALEIRTALRRRKQ